MELLIVIVVMAILAAISIVAYTGIQDRARSTAAMAAAKQVSDAIALYAVDEGGDYPADLADIEIQDTGNTRYQYRSSNTSTPKTWCATVTVGTKSVYVSNEQTTPTEGACAGHGRDGAPAITNLVPIPSLEDNAWGYSAAGAPGANSLRTSGGFSGDNFVRRTFSGTGTNGIYFGNTVAARPLVSAGETYTASAWVRSSKPVVQRIRIEWRNDTGRILTTTGAPVNVEAGWTRLSVTAAAPAGATNATLTFYSATQWTAGEYTDVDAVMLTEGGTLHDYADGDSQSWIWNGTSHRSTSTGPAL